MKKYFNMSFRLLIKFVLIRLVVVHKFRVYNSFSIFSNIFSNMFIENSGKSTITYLRGQILGMKKIQ